MNKLEWILRICLIAGGVLLSSTVLRFVRGVELPQADPEQTRWTTYVHPELGFSIEVPETYEFGEYDGARTILFSYRGATLIAISCTATSAPNPFSRREAMGDTSLDGVTGKLYRYALQDGPVHLSAESHVVTHDDLRLALEFRGLGETGALDRHILASFRFR